MKGTILTAGYATMDVLLNTPYTPTEGRIVNSRDKYAFTPGGSGAYTAVAASRCDVDVALCARVGEDEQGDRLIRYLKDEGVSTNYVASDPVNQTGLSVFLLEEYGLGGRIVYKGANGKLSVNNVESAFNCCPDLFVANMELDIEVLNYSASLCKTKGIPFVLDATGAYENIKLSGLYGDNIIIVGEKEAEILTGVRTDSTENYLRASISLCDKMPLRFVVLKLGKRGAYIYDGKYCELLMSPGLQTVDTTAEHQTFVGAFCADFIRNYDVYSATKYGLAASALAASKVGGFASIPTGAEIANILD